MKLVKDVVLEQSVDVYQRRGRSAYGRPLHGSGVMFLTAKSTIRSASDPRCRDRQLFLLATVYVVSITVSVTEVIRGNQPVLSLVALPIPLLLVYWLLRTASRTRVPPQ